MTRREFCAMFAIGVIAGIISELDDDDGEPGT